MNQWLNFLHSIVDKLQLKYFYFYIPTINVLNMATGYEDFNITLHKSVLKQITAIKSNPVQFLN